MLPADDALRDALWQAVTLPADTRGRNRYNLSHRAADELCEPTDPLHSFIVGSGMTDRLATVARRFGYRLCLTDTAHYDALTSERFQRASLDRFTPERVSPKYRDVVPHMFQWSRAQFSIPCHLAMTQVLRQLMHVFTTNRILFTCRSTVRLQDFYERLRFLGGIFCGLYTSKRSVNPTKHLFVSLDSLVRFQHIQWDLLVVIGAEGIFHYTRFLDLMTVKTQRVYNLVAPCKPESPFEELWAEVLFGPRYDPQQARLPDPISRRIADRPMSADRQLATKAR